MTPATFRVWLSVVQDRAAERGLGGRVRRVDLAIDVR